MPVIDETIHTLELKAFKREFMAVVEDLKARLAKIEAKVK